TLDLAFRGGADGIEAEKRARRDDDAGAALARPLDEIEMLEQGAGAQRHEDAPGGNGRLGDGAELRRGEALDDDVSALSERGQRHDGSGDAGGGEPRFGPRGVAR